MEALHPKDRVSPRRVEGGLEKRVVSLVSSVSQEESWDVVMMGARIEAVETSDLQLTLQIIIILLQQGLEAGVGA